MTSTRRLVLVAAILFVSACGSSDTATGNDAAEPAADASDSLAQQRADAFVELVTDRERASTPRAGRSPRIR